MAVIPEGELPNFFQMKYTDTEGYLTSEATLYNDQLYRFLLGIFNGNGIVVPSRTTAEITGYGNDSSVALGTIWFCTDLGGGAKLQVKTAAGTIETITSV